MKKKTYGVPRLVDLVANIKVGAATMKVHFTGGALTAYGVTPAEYTTADPFIQKVIEQSKYYKEGRIVLLRETGIPDEVKVPNPTEEVANSTADSTGHTYKELEEVNATCLQDAQAYLQEHFGIPSYKVRSYDAAQQAAYEHGFKFVGEKFGNHIAMNGKDLS